MNAALPTAATVRETVRDGRWTAWLLEQRDGELVVIVERDAGEGEGPYASDTMPARGTDWDWLAAQLADERETVERVEAVERDARLASALAAGAVA